MTNKYNTEGAHPEEQYLSLLEDIVHSGRYKSDRTGVGCYSVTGSQMRFDLSTGKFPLFTSKKTSLKNILVELTWLLGNHRSEPKYSNLDITNVQYLRDNGCTIWDEWADENGDLGPVYGKQWREHSRLVVADDNHGIWQQYVDQMGEAQHTLNTNPESRRIIVNAWNVEDLPKMALTPCHAFFQFISHEMTMDERIREFKYRTANAYAWETPSDAHTPTFRDYIHHSIVSHGIFDSDPEERVDSTFDDWGIPRRRLDLVLTQRSADMFLGVPYNVASYSALLLAMAKATNHAAGEFVWNGGDCHVYSNHLDQVDTLLTRTPYSLPFVAIDPHLSSINEVSPRSFQLIGYESHPGIRAKVAV